MQDQKLHISLNGKGNIKYSGINLLNYNDISNYTHPLSINSKKLKLKHGKSSLLIRFRIKIIYTEYSYFSWIEQS